jgi:hypothetical protein
MHRYRHRQERWLHTRISADLEEALKREARRRRTPVSLLVRNVLEGALDVVEEIVEDGLALAESSRRFGNRAGRAAGEKSLDDIYGWQELILNRAARCTGCDTVLTSGAGAYRGLRERSGPPVFLCPRCVRRLRRTAEQNTAEQNTAEQNEEGES